MTEVRTLIVDDESLARRGIRQLLAPYPEFTVVGECREGRDAVRALGALRPDLVFLDIEMPGLDGLGVIRDHGIENMPLTVFVTAHEEFAVRAFDAHAIDYLVKPLGEARFRTTIERVRERLRVQDAVALAGRLSALLAGETAHGGGTMPAPGSAQQLLVDTETGQLLLDVAQIGWLGADDSFSAVHVGGKRYRVRRSLHEMEQALDAAHFLRIHRSAIVRLDQVREVRVESSGDAVATAILRDGTQLPVSRRKLSRLKALLQPWTRH